MKTKNLFYALALGVAFTACSQEEIVNDSANLIKGDSFKNYAGEVFDGNISFTKDGGAESRMAVENGTPSWINDDMVGLVWTNAADGTETNGWIEKPTTSNIYSNTRMTYDANAGNWYMTDGQIFKGMYLAYYPFNEDIQSVQQFAVSQDNVQIQTNSTTKTLNEVAEKLVWMSQRYEDDEDVTKNATFVYPFVQDDVESGTGREINVRMKPFSNILDARFNIAKRTTPAIDLDPEVVTVKDLKLVVLKSGALQTVWPTTAKFDLSSWGWEWDVESNGPSGLDGRKLVVENGDNGYEEADKVQWINVKFANEAPNAGETQRANFMFLPYDLITDPACEYAIRVETDYGYVYIKESEWKKAATNNGGLMVNPTQVAAMAPVQASNMMNTLTNRIGAQAVRYFNAYAQDFVYNNIKVSDTAELVEAIRKWNVLGKQGTFTVVVDNDNEFENLVWSEAATVNVDGDTWDTPAAIQEFLADARNVLNVTVETPTTKVVFNNAVIDDGNTLLLDNVTVQSNGKLQVNVDQTIEVLNTTAGSELIIPADGKVIVKQPSLFEGNTTVAQTGELEITSGASITNEGELTLNGKLNIPASTTTRFNNNGTFNLLTHGHIAGTTSGAWFYNEGIFNFVEIGELTDTSWSQTNGKIVASINDANKGTALSSYIEAASDFQPNHYTVLKIETSSNLEAEWDNTANNLSFEEINLADGVTLKLAENFDAPDAVINVTGNVTIATVNTVVATQLSIAGLVLEAGATLDITDTLINVDVSGDIEMKGAAGQTTTLNGIAQTNKVASDIVKASSGTYSIN